MSKRLTVADLIARKEQLKQRQQSKQTLHVDSLDAEITIVEPSHELALESLEMVRDDGEQADVHMVYHSVIEPNLKDKSLQEAFGCAEPTDIVKMIFKPGELAAISGIALSMAGYGQGVRKVDETIKN